MSSEHAPLGGPVDGRLAATATTSSVPLTFVGTSDLSGLLRGKAVPTAALVSRPLLTVGWMPSNSRISCFGTTDPASTTSVGELLLRPDLSTESTHGLDGRRRGLVLADVTTMDGEAWGSCPREMLRRAILRLRRVAGLHLKVAFEHEFQFLGDPPRFNSGYSAQAFEHRRPFAEELMGTLEAAGVDPQEIMAEYGPDQYEVVVAPTDALRAADRAVVVRELARTVARHHGDRLTFSPFLDPNGSVGNGVHIHFSLWNKEDAPVTLSTKTPGTLSDVAGRFCAGILSQMDSVVPFSAPSFISYQRLQEGRWAASLRRLEAGNREAALRLCMGPQRGSTFSPTHANIEFRAADATASPYIALAALVHAGVDGLAAASPGLDPETLGWRDEAEDTRGSGVFDMPTEPLLRLLPALSSEGDATRWFGGVLVEDYLAVKRAEWSYLEDLDVAARHTAYRFVY